MARLAALLVLLLGFAGAAAAQTEPVLPDGQSVVSFNGPWRFQRGDDPAWAAPAFDDSGWPAVTTTLPLAKQGLGDFSGWGWYRIRVRVPHSDRPLAVYMPEVRSAYTAYANGQEIGRFGSGPPSVRRYAGEPKVFALPDARTADTMTLAVRVWTAPSASIQGMSSDPAMVGDRTLIQAMGHREHTNALFHSLGYFLLSLFDFVLCIAMLGLFLAQRHHREYLWLGLSNLFEVAYGLLVNFSFLSAVPMSWGFYTGNACLLLSFVFGIEFAFAFVRLKPWRFVRVLQAVLVAVAATGFVSQVVPVLPLSALAVVSAPAGLIFSVLLLAVILPQGIKGNSEARILLPPAMLWAVASSIELANFVAISYGWGHVGPGDLRPHLLPDINLGEIPIATRVVFGIALDLAFIVVVLYRHTRVSRERARVSAELEAARVVQHVLLPDPDAVIAGFHIEAEYMSAQEVGGDFYQMLPMADGGLLVVAGDVSGKGMPAAMLVAMLVGVIRAEAAHTSNPARLLETLNKRVYGRMSGGFATCAALHLSPDGSAVLASAANPAPYLNGEEVELEGALPLGLLADAVYEEHRFKFEDGDVLTFVSDGVVEAQSAAGKTLLGFERTQAMSMQSAADIAQAARLFGQTDDITVLRVSRLVNVAA
jgi:hypothetical protein